MKPKLFLSVAAGALSLAVATGPAAAQSARDGQPGIKAGDVLLRLRAIMVAPNERSGSILPAFPGEEARVDNSFMPEIDATYMASDHIGVELIASTTKHHADGRTGTTGSIGRLASTWVLPPTLTAQYHFAPTSHVRPYVGAGLNYTIFWNEKASSGLEKAVGATRVHMKDSVGWAAQAGIDVDLTRRVFLNLDVKYIDIDTTARLQTTAAGTQRVRLSLDPLVVGVGLGFKL
ncbi:OmpW/AlkL family protein [Sphingomonas abaci]|uniref:Outer membrane protein n=1 Tax=Sphingomonas abaci TaxID=237611 RepID=A0A7W7EZA8_9SPHN|nr:OmpW family outer membrane protein [Sphingomonas abaci]MBB4619623.1 outer membrane protein [Sphingomonas abaci]